MWDNNKFPVRLILNGQASKEIEWHCKVSDTALVGCEPRAHAYFASQHYVGRGLMKRFETGEELAKEMGLPAKKIQDTFSNYVEITKDPKKDPFGKKL